MRLGKIAKGVSVLQKKKRRGLRIVPLRLGRGSGSNIKSLIIRAQSHFPGPISSVSFPCSPLPPSLLSFRLYAIFSFKYRDRPLTGLPTSILLCPHLISPYCFSKLSHVTPLLEPSRAPSGAQEKVISL